MRWIKKIIRAVLCLIPCCAFLFVPSCSALKHTYDGISLFTPFVGLKYSDGSVSVDPSYVSGSFDPFTEVGAGFGWQFNGSDFDFNNGDSLPRMKPLPGTLSLYPWTYTAQTNRGLHGNEFPCYYENQQYSMHSVFTRPYGSNYRDFVSENAVVAQWPYYATVDTSSDPYEICNSLEKYGEFGSSYSQTGPSFEYVDTFPNGTVDAITQTVTNSDFYPYRFATAVLNSTSTSVTQGGIHYTESFKSSYLFEEPISKFEEFRVPFWDYNNYFANADNLWSGRNIEFHLLFNFPGATLNTLGLNPDFSTNGTTARLYYSGQRSISASNFISSYKNHVDCTLTWTEYNVDSSAVQLHASCSLDLPYDFVALYPLFVLDGNDHYIWQNDFDWTWSSTYIVTDHDDSPGDPMNEGEFGNYDMWTAPSGSGEPDFTSSLANLFGFTFINPFAPIFDMFSDNSSCASIPTVAGMIHSEEITVCPWFDSNVRAIVTPVLGISSMMLVFGFAVRWLGSSSGNLFEDSKHETINSSGRHKK